MTIDFSADEIFEMAQQVERNGATFYRRAAAAVPDPSDRELLLELAAMEDDHERVFASMREDVLGSEEGPTPFDPQGEAAAYLRAIADGQVFDMDPDPAKFLEYHHGTEDILRKAIALEKESIIFYTGMKEMVSKSLGKERIEQIIREEMKHVVSLNKALTAGQGSISG